MPTLILETGAREAGANSYASLATVDAYADSRPYGNGEWAALSNDQKIRCLIMATLMIDSLFKWSGYMSSTTQSLRWPRQFAINPDGYGIRNALENSNGNYFASNEIPALLIKAVCEQAVQLALSDRTTAAGNEGISEVDIFEAVRVKFSQNTEASPQIPALIQQMLAGIGSYQSSRGGAVKLQRT